MRPAADPLTFGGRPRGYVERLRLAYELARELADAPAACRGRGKWWTMQENAYAAATTPAPGRVAVTSPAGGRAAAAAVALVCGGCPVSVVDTCRQLAETDRYTGFAAGVPYRDGHRVADPDIDARSVGTP